MIIMIHSMRQKETRKEYGSARKANDKATKVINILNKIHYANIMP